MIRFRNPGTQYTTQIQVIRQLYKALHHQTCFTLEDMAVVIAQGRLMTAYGYAGDDALRLSNTDQESMNSALMNAKMYAEVFRMLGWVTPYSEKSSYPLVFTYIGIHIALSKGECSRLYEQCVLGINTPTQLCGKMRYSEKMRFFKCALRSFIDLDGIMYKHELCLGPMSINDEDEREYQSMIQCIKSLRGDHKRLKKAFEDLASTLGMKPTPVDNCTRLPIAFMKSCSWIESIRDKSLYGKSLDCLKITNHGIETYEHIKDMYDLRLDQYIDLDPHTQHSMIRLGTYSMLMRSGYDMSDVLHLMESDKVQCQEIIGDKELLFSPAQTIRRSQIEEALDLKLGLGIDSQYHIDAFESTVKERERLNNTQVWKLSIPDSAAKYLLKASEDRDFLQRIDQMLGAGKNSRMIVNILFDDYLNATQETFYPLVATLFKIMGFNCSSSRQGDNGARWDAIIDDPTRSIPIEIKSPTEEQHLSIKAVRQALENKIILLSRKTHITTPDVSTLAVGYYMPNERAEVVRLISYFKDTYGFNVGIIDLKTLLSLAISILVDKKGFDKEKLYKLEGLASANI